MDHAKKIIQTLVENHHTAYFAGGWVRDHVMGNDPTDVDIATSASPDQIVNLFRKTIKVGMAFGVVIVIVDGEQCEVATFRRDLEYSNGRTPDTIEFCSPREDAMRRDFTINGLFYNPLTHEIFDYVGGVRDIKDGIIRTIGNPSERFSEDKLRMLRAFRFASRFSFVIDQDTQDAIYENANSLLPAVSMERIWQEFYKMSQYPRFDMALIEMHRLELLPVIFPELKGMHLKDLKANILNFKYFPKDTPTILYLAQLFKNASKDEMIELCRYLKTSKQEVDCIHTYFEAKNLILLENQNKIFNPTDWVRFFAKKDALICLEVASFAYFNDDQHLNDKRFIHRLTKLSPHIDRILKNRPVVSGKKLLDLGLKPGKNIGFLLDEAERFVIANDIHDPEVVIDYLRKSPHWH